MRIACSEGFTQICRSETLTTPKSISIPDSYQNEGFTPVCRIAEVRASLEIKDINFCTLAIINF